MRQELIAQPEPFKFDLESDALETSFEEFENYEASESEAMIGGIPQKDYLRWIQFSLNMYFKKTGLRAPLIEDGKDSADFRNAVELFNARAWGRSKNKQIDEKFQDALIRVNETNSGYLKWLRAQLDRLGFAPFTVVYLAHEKPTKAIEEFQRIHSKKYGFSLEKDGFIGAKTHLALLHAIKRLSPKPPIKAVKIETLTIWLNAFIPNDLPESFLHRPDVGPYRGKVFLKHPGFPIDDSHYATDQRSWSKQPNASSRMHSRIDILMRHGTLSSIRRKEVGQTIRISRFGNVLCKKRADPENTMEISELRQINSDSLAFSFSGNGANPCTPPVSPSPEINYALDVSIMLAPDRGSASIRVKGGIDEFPSFEMYAAANDDFKNAVTLFRRRASDSGPKALFGEAVRRIDVSGDLTIPRELNDKSG